MFGLDIITKPGILVFSHEFVKDWSVFGEEERDLDLHASLITAALGALKETQGETITAIRQVGYTLILYEGVLTYGILTASEDDPKMYEFLKGIVLKFELMFTHELHAETFVNRKDFEIFRPVVKEMYDNMVGIDVGGLRKVLKVMNRSKIANYIVYETKFFQPIFTSIVDPKVNLPVHSITKIFRNINNLCVSQKKEKMTCEIDFDEILVHAIRIPTHLVICLCAPHKVNKENIVQEINDIKNSLFASRIKITELVSPGL
ncbi:MAG: hypothetical protein ACFE9L_04220 [Candidatus Hodarchaeota archaeon]